MNTHKHARLTFILRLEMVQQLISNRLTVTAAAQTYGVMAPKVRKWLGRFPAQGKAGLADASSRPAFSPKAIAPAKALAIGQPCVNGPTPTPTRTHNTEPMP